MLTLFGAMGVSVLIANSSGGPAGVTTPASGVAVRTLGVVAPVIPNWSGARADESDDPDLRRQAEEAVAAIHAALEGADLRLLDHGLAGTPYSAFALVRFAGTGPLQVQRSRRKSEELAMETVKLAKGWGVDGVLFSWIAPEARSQAQTAAVSGVGIAFCCLAGRHGGMSLGSPPAAPTVHLALVDGRTGTVLWEVAETNRLTSAGELAAHALATFRWPDTDPEAHSP